MSLALDQFKEELDGQDLSILIGFDEPQSLHGDNRQNYLEARKGLSRVFALVERYHSYYHANRIEGRRWRLFSPLLSTQGPLSDLTSPELIYPSARQLNPQMLRPYLAFPFDVISPAKEPKDLEDCQRIEHLQCLGRPLYVLFAYSFQTVNS